MLEAPLRREPAGQGDRRGPRRASASTTCATFATDPHRRWTTTRSAAGPGMVMKAEPVFAAVESLDPDRGRVILLSPAGRRLDQALVRELSAEAASHPHLRALRGGGRARRGRTPGRGGLDRRLRVVRWRGAGPGADRGRHAADPRGDRPARSRTSRIRSANPACSTIRTTRGPGSSAGCRSPRCSLSGNHARDRARGGARPPATRRGATAPTSARRTALARRPATRRWYTRPPLP